jgi:hypothetical protein
LVAFSTTNNAERLPIKPTLPPTRIVQGVVLVAFLTLIIASTVVLGQATPDTIIPRVPDPPLNSDLINLPGDLRAVAVPTPSNLDDFVSDPAMARALGNALFWGYASRKRWRAGLRELSLSCRR